MAASAPTFVGGHQIGVSSSSSSHTSHTPGDHSPANIAEEDTQGGGAERSFFEQERDKLVEEIAGGFEELLSSANVLNRKLEEVFGVGKEFQTVANLWGQFNTLIRDQKDDPASDSAIPNQHPPLGNSAINTQQQQQLRTSQGVPGTGGATFGPPPTTL
ncbi:hypothetical protein QFC22_005460 [Naganishia vaughanmartiniae]|uniref:Uncharacterized protein n=1 Tax=Naganishia vaughanmartiniae TaxID=1424756 RepID=A0ACC2WUZ8_9TREE|nr:hypothetical protein QFC22_005460 [Naganishia vaughanmartiniae]